MQFSWQDIIDRARVYIDDDHKDERGFIAADKMLILANVEYADLRKRWIRQALVRPAPTDTQFVSTNTQLLTGVLAIVGVAEISQPSGTPYRLLTPAQSAWGAQPYWGSVPAYKSSTWIAQGEGDNVTITLDPPDNASTYVTRWVPTIPYATDPTTTIDLPYGQDERLVLGLAKRMHVKDQTRSAAIQDLIQQADAETAFTAFGRIQADGPRVRRVRPTVAVHRSFPGFCGNPSGWYFP